MIKSEQASLSVTRIAIITIITIFALSVRSAGSKRRG